LQVLFTLLIPSDIVIVIMLVTHDYQQLQKQVGVFFNLFGSDPSFDLTVSSVRGWSKKSQQFAESPKFFFL